MENIINQIFEIEKKANSQNLVLFERNFSRIYHEFEEIGYKIVNPINTIYDERDASVEATIIDLNAKIITKVIKPTIYQKINNQYTLIQKGIVIVD